MRLSDLPPREQDRYLDGITVGIGTRALPTLNGEDMESLALGPTG